jgi:general bacterial porin, GBP family
MLKQNRQFFTVFGSTLLTSALIGAGTVNNAHAQSSVTLYGVVDLGLSYQRNKAGSAPEIFKNPNQIYSQFGLASGQEASSRWGLKGVEDLGNGLKANFVYESGIDATNGTASGFTRQSTLGLTQNGIGSVDLGRRLSPGSIAFVGIDPMNYSYSIASLDSSMGATNVRFSNMVVLATDDFSGFRLSAGYSFDTGLKAINSPVKPGAFGTSNKFRAVSVAARYSSGPLLVAAMFDTYLSPSGENSSSVKQWNIGGAYDFKVVKLHAAYGQNIDGRVSGTNTLGNTETTGGDTNTRGAVLFAPGARTNSWMVGLSAPTGAQGKLFASVQQMRPGGNFTQGARTMQTTSSVGYSYQFSKRTDAYIYYSYMDSPDMHAGGNAQVLGTGIRHLF